MQEREIDLIDLLVEVLLRWRVMIVWMLVGGILMGGLSYVNSYRASEAHKVQKAELEQQLQQKKEQLASTQQENAEVGGSTNLIDKEYLREQLTEQQENNVNVVLNNEKYIAKLQNYAQNSVLMQLDAGKASKTQLTFLIKSLDAEKSASIEKVYEDVISNGFVQWLVENGSDEVDATGVGELISLKRSSAGLLMGSDSFSVNIVHVTEEQCTMLAEELIAYVNEQQGQLQDVLGTHTIEVVNRSFACVTDVNLLRTQQNIKNEITTGITNVAKLKETFSDAEWKYYNFMTSGKSQGTPEEYEKETTEATAEESVKDTSTVLETITVTSPTVSVKYVILGMILFDFVYVFYVFMKYILDNCIRVNDDVKELYGIPQLAVIPSGVTAGKPFAFVDKWILKLRDRNKRTFSEEEATGLATVAVKMQAKKEGLDAVYCIGCNLKEKSLQIAEQIQTTLQEDGISITVLNNVLYNQESMEQLQGAKAVFLLEKAGETLYDEIVQELELLQRQGIKVLGAVVVE